MSAHSPAFAHVMDVSKDNFSMPYNTHFNEILATYSERTVNTIDII